MSKKQPRRQFRVVIRFILASKGVRYRAEETYYCSERFPSEAYEKARHMLTLDSIEAGSVVRVLEWTATATLEWKVTAAGVGNLLRHAQSKETHRSLSARSVHVSPDDLVMRCEDCGHVWEVKSVNDDPACPVCPAD